MNLNDVHRAAHGELLRHARLRHTHLRPESEQVRLDVHHTAVSAGNDLHETKNSRGAFTGNNRLHTCRQLLHQSATP